MSEARSIPDGTDPGLSPVSEGPRFTPGPWAVSEDAPLWITGPDRDAPVICDLLPRDEQHGYTDEDYANADLIAAAPDLLAALERIMDETTFGDRMTEAARRLADAAIARATPKGGQDG